MGLQCFYGAWKNNRFNMLVKRLIDDAIDTLYIPVLIAVRENSMGLEILNAINEHSEGAAVYVCAENKNEAEK